MLEMTKAMAQTEREKKTKQACGMEDELVFELFAETVCARERERARERKNEKGPWVAL